MIELADVVRRHWPAYEQKYGAQILPSHRAAVEAILTCRTAALGGQLYACEPCGQQRYVYHSCQHRACPKCGHAEASEWIGRQKTRLLPVPYFLVTFTVPEQLRSLIRSHQKDLFDLLFRESAAAMQDVAANPKHLGAQLGMLGVLHTWSRQLIYHPHIHYVVAGGGLSDDGLFWRRVKQPGFFLPEKVLAARWRNRFKQALEAAHPLLFASVPAKVWRIGWVVDCIAVGRGESALQYLSAYVYKSALGSQRIVCDDGHRVSFTYRDSHKPRGSPAVLRGTDGVTKTATVTAEEFLRRFLQHVLPAGFQRVRYFGWLSAAAKARRERIESLLEWKRPESPVSQPLPPPVCPHCKQAMVWIERLARAPPSE
jgi:hypothetical protein